MKNVFVVVVEAAMQVSKRAISEEVKIWLLVDGSP